MITEIKQQCAGRWSGVLVSLGMPHKAFSGKHGDCLVCGDQRKNARWNAKKEYWVCSKCGVTQGMDLALHWTGESYKHTAARIRGNRIESMTTISKEENYIENKRYIDEILSGRKKLKGSQAEQYLIARGLGVLPERDVYFHPGVEEWKGSGVYLPAMVSVFRDYEGHGATLHVTYLDGDQKAAIEKPKRFTKKAREMTGGAIRLFEAGEVLGIAEGIETALAAHSLEGIPVWAAANAQMMKQVVIPDCVKELNIYSDCDKSFTGQEAAYCLAKRYAGKIKVNVHMRDDCNACYVDNGNGGDFLDYINAMKPY